VASILELAALPLVPAFAILSNVLYVFCGLLAWNAHRPVN